MSLPTADDLFRPTVTPDQSPEPETSAGRAVAAVPDPEPERGDGRGDGRGEATGTRKPSGRVRHDEKMTVYVTSDELLDLEHARLTLRRAHGLTADRGRIVREAVAMVLADFEENGPDSALVQRLRES